MSRPPSVTADRGESERAVQVDGAGWTEAGRDLRRGWPGSGVLDVPDVGGPRLPGRRGQSRPPALRRP